MSAAFPVVIPDPVPEIRLRPRCHDGQMGDTRRPQSTVLVDTHRPAETAQYRPVTALSLVDCTYRHLHLLRRVSAGAGGQRPHDRGRGGGSGEPEVRRGARRGCRLGREHKRCGRQSLESSHGARPHVGREVVSGCAGEGGGGGCPFLSR